MERKSFECQVEWKKDSQEGEFTATFSTFNCIDGDKDVTFAGAFTDGEEVPISHWGHGWNDLPVGRGTVRADSQKAWIEGKFFTDTETGKEHYLTVKHLGQLQQWSYGYDVLDSQPGQFEGQDVRFLKRLKVIEVSPVMRAAGVGTGTTDIKAGSEEKAVTRSEADGDHPASHYLVVEDPQKPSTWHLRVRDANGDLDHRLMGAAWAALHGGYRGNRYEGPGKEEAIRKLRRLYEQEGLEVPKADWDGELKPGPHDHSRYMKYGARHTGKEFEQIQQLHDIAVGLGAKCSQEESGEEEGGGKDETGKQSGKSSNAPSREILAARVAAELLSNNKQ